MQNPLISTEGPRLVGIVFISGKEEMTSILTQQLSAYDWPGIERVIIYCLDHVPATEPLPPEFQTGRVVFRSTDELFKCA